MADNTSAVPWWAWLVAVLCGVFFINAIPHTVMGLTGQPFPTPFSGGPPNLSPAWLNVVWGYINIALGWVLWTRAIGRWNTRLPIRLTAIAAAALFGLMLGYVFETMM